MWLSCHSVCFFFAGRGGSWRCGRTHRLIPVRCAHDLLPAQATEPAGLSDEARDEKSTPPERTRRDLYAVRLCAPPGARRRLTRQRVEGTVGRRLGSIVSRGGVRGLAAAVR